MPGTYLTATVGPPAGSGSAEFLDLRGAQGAGSALYRLIERLYPFCRSITGDGVRETLAVVAEGVPLQIHEVPTGTRVFDWSVPNEWNIRDAYVKDATGHRVVDFQVSNLHVVNYSVSVRRRMTLAELRPHLHSLPDRPDTVPYRTSYYNETWGFCLAHEQLERLPHGEYEVCIDSTLKAGALTYGEMVLPGRSEQEILLSAHVCHPSLANDNLSGIALLAWLAERLGVIDHYYTYRLIFAPGTIGSITWLARNEDRVHRIEHGLVLACLGDAGGPTYKRSRRGNAVVDRAVTHVLKHRFPAPSIRDFSPYGYDERQYCSPGFNLPVGLLERSAYGEFPEYHTSADDLEFVTPDALAESLDMVLTILDVLERDKCYENLNPKCEPQLGKRGLYDALGGENDRASLQLGMLWVLNQSDGTRSLLDIAERSDLPFEQIATCARLLVDGGLLRPVSSR
jgi:aminopeptidase-like protein